MNSIIPRFLRTSISVFLLFWFYLPLGPAVLSAQERLIDDDRSAAERLRPATNPNEMFHATPLSDVEPIKASIVSGLESSDAPSLLSQQQEEDEGNSLDWKARALFGLAVGALTVAVIMFVSTLQAADEVSG